MFASGSWDGSIRLWKIDERIRSFSLMTTIDAPGFVNSLQIIAPSLRPTRENHLPRLDAKKKKKDEEESGNGPESKNLVVVAGVAKEPRLGRWMRLKEGREGAIVAVIPMQ